MYSRLEDLVYKLYTSIGVKDPTGLEMHKIAKKLGVEITYDENKVFRFENEISLKKRTKRQEWMDFGHELGHCLMHCGLQVSMHPLFVELQEWQANNFAYHFCVPTFMLDKLYNYTVCDVMQLFNVDYDFACKRLEIYKNKKQREIIHGQAAIT
ncbi:ImmA/IrrE family metallo-endopeptidase [Virgibacillus salarius]|uniref:ImmA/IrrE family metallo-endopeptidase n=1 Tax=Virgibacillus salarius TaxID=447199 RepID=UPI0031D5F93E